MSLAGCHPPSSVSAVVGFSECPGDCVVVGVAGEVNDGGDGPLQERGPVLVDVHFDDAGSASGERFQGFAGEVHVGLPEFAFGSDGELAAGFFVFRDVVDDEGRDAVTEQWLDPDAGELFGVFAAVVVESGGVVGAGGGVDHHEPGAVLDDVVDVICGWRSVGST